MANIILNEKDLHEIISSYVENAYGVKCFHGPSGFDVSCDTFSESEMEQYEFSISFDFAVEE